MTLGALFVGRIERSSAKIRSVRIETKLQVLAQCVFERKELFRVFGATLRISGWFKRESPPMSLGKIVQCANILMKATVLPTSLFEQITSGADFPNPVTVDNCSFCGPFLLRTVPDFHERKPENGIEQIVHILERIEQNVREKLHANLLPNLGMRRRQIGRAL